MKYIAAIILLLNFLSFASCQKNENKTENNLSSDLSSDLNTKPLSKLFQIIKSKQGENIELKEDEIVVGKSKIKVSTTVEFDGIKQGKWIFAARYDTKLVDTSETTFTVGSIGIGSDKNDAEETSIDEWIALFGTAFSEMLTKPKGTAINDFNFYSGLMGIRGEKPSQSWIDGSSEMNKKIINALLPIIRKSSKEMNSLNLMLSVNPNGEIAGECRFNNEISQEVLTELKKLNWEKSQTGYVFKQFYLLKKSQAKV